jgi:hypothetical protein
MAPEELRLDVAEADEISLVRQSVVATDGTSPTAGIARRTSPE